MKTTLAALALALLSAAALPGAALTQDVNVHSRPEVAAPVIGRLRAGAEPLRAPDATASTPAGWMAVQLPSSTSVFVANGDVTKALDVREGAPLLSEPRAGASVLGTMEKGDRSEIAGLRGRFTEVKVERTFVGYILLGPAASPPSPPAPGTISATGARPSPIDTSSGLAPRASEPMGAIRAPGAAPIASLGSPVGGAVIPGAAPGTLPRTIQGNFASSQRPFTPRRPYDYQINDDAGIRIAYVDLSRARMSEQPERYVGRTVIVTGLAENSVEARAVVIVVESLNLK